MRLKFAALIPLAAVLSGCVGSPASVPPDTTAADPGSARVASAVAKTSPELEAALNHFDVGNCSAILQPGTPNSKSSLDCARTLIVIGTRSRNMHDDLEAAKPWSGKTRALAEETTLSLDVMTQTSEYGDDIITSETEGAMDRLRSQLQEWKRLGAQDPAAAEARTSGDQGGSALLL